MAIAVLETEAAKVERLALAEQLASCRLLWRREARNIVYLRKPN